MDQSEELVVDVGEGAGPARHNSRRNRHTFPIAVLAVALIVGVNPLDGGSKESGLGAVTSQPNQPTGSDTIEGYSIEEIESVTIQFKLLESDFSPDPQLLENAIYLVHRFVGVGALDPLLNGRTIPLKIVQDGPNGVDYDKVEGYFIQLNNDLLLNLVNNEDPRARLNALRSLHEEFFHLYQNIKYRGLWDKMQVIDTFLDNVFKEFINQIERVRAFNILLDNAPEVLNGIPPELFEEPNSANSSGYWGSGLTSRFSQGPNGYVEIATEIDLRSNSYQLGFLFRHHLNHWSVDEIHEQLEQYVDENQDGPILLPAFIESLGVNFYPTLAQTMVRDRVSVLPVSGGPLIQTVSHTIMREDDIVGIHLDTQSSSRGLTVPIQIAPNTTAYCSQPTVIYTATNGYMKVQRLGLLPTGEPIFFPGGLPGLIIAMSTEPLEIVPLSPEEITEPTILKQVEAYQEIGWNLSVSGYFIVDTDHLQNTTDYEQVMNIYNRAGGQYEGQRLLVLPEHYIPGILQLPDVKPVFVLPR